MTRQTATSYPKRVIIQSACLDWELNTLILPGRLVQPIFADLVSASPCKKDLDLRPYMNSRFPVVWITVPATDPSKRFQLFIGAVRFLIHIRKQIKGRNMKLNQSHICLVCHRKKKKLSNTCCQRQRVVYCLQFEQRAMFHNAGRTLFALGPVNVSVSDPKVSLARVQ